MFPFYSVTDVPGCYTEGSHAAGKSAAAQKTQKLRQGLIEEGFPRLQVEQIFIWIQSDYFRMVVRWQHSATYFSAFHVHHHCSSRVQIFILG
jgi:hypothetical protein